MSFGVYLNKNTGVFGKFDFPVQEIGAFDPYCKGCCVFLFRIKAACTVSVRCPRLVESRPEFGNNLRLFDSKRSW